MIEIVLKRRQEERTLPGGRYLGMDFSMMLRKVARWSVSIALNLVKSALRCSLVPWKMLKSPFRNTIQMRSLHSRRPKAAGTEKHRGSRGSQTRSWRGSGKGLHRAASQIAHTPHDRLHSPKYNKHKIKCDFCIIFKK